jgi:FkbM family methyltransferase
MKSRGIQGSALDYILPKMVKFYQTGFCRFADCGAGVGHTALGYVKALKDNLSEDALQKASIYAYEPLPENFAELSLRTKEITQIKARNTAVSNFTGSSSFLVPSRMTGKSQSWGEATSAVGYLSDAVGGETVNVEVVQLENEIETFFDFLKLDLQGGERNALIGVGKRLREVKLVYAEHQLLGRRESQPLDFLLSNGFVCFFDALQFGFDKKLNEPPLKLLKEAGVEIDRVRLADSRGFPNIFWGTLSMEKSTRLKLDGTFPQDFIDKLRDAGLVYLQTDVLAININNQHEVLNLI